MSPTAFRHVAVGVAVAALVAFATALLTPNAHPLHAQAPETRIGVDADTTGSSATTLGAIDECVEIGAGDSHTIDVYVKDVANLMAWEAIVSFEPKVLEIVDGDVKLFMASDPGSDVQSVSGELPDDDGHYQIGAFDAADPLSPNSGSGVLARLTVRGIGPGVSQIRLPLTDLTHDGKPDEGPLLRDADVNSIGDVNGDALFDGPIAEARIAVDASCADELGPAGQSKDDQPNGDDGGIGALTIIVVIVGFAGSIAVGGLAWALVWRRRR